MQRDTTADIQNARNKFERAITDAEIKFTLISQQQGATVQQMKEAELDKDQPSIIMDVLANIIGVAISAALPGIGSAIAALTTEELAQEAVKAAFKKGAGFASEKAKDALKESPTETKLAEEYFNGMAKTYPALAGHEMDGFSESMEAVWAKVGADVSKAQDAQNQAEQAKAALQQALDSQAYVQATMDAAFSGYANTLAQANSGGVLNIETTVANNGNIGGKVIESAVVGGVSSKLAGLVAGRPLSAYKMGVVITASYFTEPTETGDESESDVPRLHTFTVSVSPDGNAQGTPTADPWLVARGQGDPTAGAQGLYDDLRDVPIPISVA